LVEYRTSAKLQEDATRCVLPSPAGARSRLGSADRLWGARSTGARAFAWHCKAPNDLAPSHGPDL